MLRGFCRSKITKGVVTDTVLHYNGSIGIDADILAEADLLPGEQVHVLNVNNGERLVTYVIEEERASGQIVLYGPAAKKGSPGDELVILAYCLISPEEHKDFRQKITVLEKGNKCVKN